MLLWKCWRDLRIAFFIGLGWLALLTAGIIEHALHSRDSLTYNVASPGHAVQIVAFFIAIQTFIFTLLAFGMGTTGIGRDIGGGSGSFLLTRPVSRGFYVWTEWFSGLIALAVLLLLSALGLWLSIRCHAIRIASFTRTGETTTFQGWTLGSLPFGVTAIDILCAFLFVALVFAVTHLGTVAYRHSTAGLIFGLSFFVAWLVVGAILRHEYPGLGARIPDLLLRPFGSHPDDLRPIPHLTASILERLAVLPLFPLLAHFFLRRTEV